mmetsp:Transcript_146057/g.468439  ORF Transcript_146057/g.468439 Transcript_146057/m.468439 type:complete len:220 (-) Transcript_146057:146-805(-)
MSYASAAKLAPQSTERRTEGQLLSDITRSLAEADQVSGRTLERLGEQTEQLHRIQDHNANIENNLDQSEWLLRGLKRWGWARNLFNRDPKGRERQEQQGKASLIGDSKSEPASQRTAERLVRDDAVRRASLTGAGGSSASSASASGTKFAPDPRAKQEGDAREKAYDDIEKLLDGLSTKTHEISRTLDGHNKMLPDMADKVDRSQSRLSNQMRDMRKMT